MPRLRDSRSRLTTGAVPSELADRASIQWRSPQSFDAWMDAHGLVSNSLTADPGPATRRKAAIESWLIGQGLTSDRFPPRLDRAKCRQALAGVSVGPYISEAIHERLANIETQEA